MSKEKLILTPLKDAVASLEKVLQQPKNEFIRDAAIQRFEYTFELAWKMIKRHLKMEAEIDEFNIKNLFRSAARIGLIDDVEPWFLYHKVHSLTSHTYNEKVAEEAFMIAKQFFPNVEKLLIKLEQYYPLV